MKIKVQNLGVLKQAEFTLGDLTIICGKNNTGKTYATYALFGFLELWEQVLSIEVNETNINQLLEDGAVHINLETYIQDYQNILDQGCKQYSQLLPKVFAASEDRFSDTVFQVELAINRNSLNPHYENYINSANSPLFTLMKERDNPELIVTLLTEKKNIKLPREIIKKIISDTIKEIIFGKILPKPFIASAERTGTAIFRKELNFARNRLLEELSHVDKNIDPFELLFKGYDDYALPIQRNVEFTRNLETIFKRKSFIANQHPNILEDFADIIGGQYIVTPEDELYFSPQKGKKVKLTMDESSSAVRSLLDIGFYLKHIAKKGDLLIIDEPELNLHPENQRRIARLFSRLVNLGVKVLINTHSDYIIKELNTLIMLNRNESYLKDILQQEGHQKNELLEVEKIKVFIAEEDLIKVKGKQRRIRGYTLNSADISPQLGIEIKSFDTAIETMNRIQESIIWGGE